MLGAMVIAVFVGISLAMFMWSWANNVNED